MYGTCKDIEGSRSNFCALISFLGVYGCYLFLLSAVAYGEVTQDGLRWVDNDLVGPVRSVREEGFELQRVGAEWIEGESTHVTVSVFNREGTFWEVLRLKPLPNDQYEKSSFCFVRGDGNRIIESFVCNAEKRSVDGTRSVYQYDLRGNLIERRTEVASSRPDKTKEVYEYDSVGRKSVSRLYDSEGGLSAITTYSRNKDNTLLTVQVSTATGDFQAKEIYSLDSMGRTSEVVSLDDEDGMISRTCLRYDDHGKWTERIFSGRGVDSQEVKSYVYDERGNWTKKYSRVIGGGEERRSITRRVIEYFTD